MRARSRPGRERSRLVRSGSRAARNAHGARHRRVEPLRRRREPAAARHDPLQRLGALPESRRGTPRRRRSTRILKARSCARTPRSTRSPRTCGRRHVYGSDRRTNRRVPRVERRAGRPLYELDKRGAFANATPEAVDFTEARLADGAAELRDLVVEAWDASATMKVGYPHAITPAEVDSGLASRRAPRRPLRLTLHGSRSARKEVSRALGAAPQRGRQLR
jgi:hypothetical protein